MPRSSSNPPAANPTSIEGIPVAAIVAMVGQGMTAREILKVFPALAPDDIRSALLRAAEVVRDADASLALDRAGEIIRAAQRSAGLSEDDATQLALRESRAARVARRKSR